MFSFFSFRQCIHYIFIFSVWLGTFVLQAQTSGTRDVTFITGTGTSHMVNALGVLPNGSVFVGGDFDTYNSQPHVGLVVLSPNGSPDSTFSANATLNTGADVRSGFVEANGDILIGGFFTTVNGSAMNKLARLKPNGTLDNTFTVGTGPNNEVSCISSNGQKIAISGFFSQYNGQSKSGFAYLNQNGTIDTNFTNSTWSSQIRTQHVLPNGKVIVGGNFSSFQNAPFNRIARLNIDGSIDTTFNPGSGASGPVEAIAIQPNGKILIGGSFTSINGQVANRVARLNQNGSVDASFNVSLGANTTVRALAVTVTGKIVVAGQFMTFNGNTVNFIVQLNQNGTVDQNFQTGTGFNGSTHALAIQQDNKVLVGGAFTQFQGSSSPRIIRLYGDSVPSVPVVPVFSQPQYTATCFGDTVVLEITGGNISPTDFWEWRMNDCQSTLLDTGLVVKFAPQSDTTTFAVKSSGAANCVTVQLIVADTVAPQINAPLPAITAYCNVSILPQDAPLATDFCVGTVVGVPKGPLSYTAPGNYKLPWLFDDGHYNIAIDTQYIEVLAIDTAVNYVGPFTWEAAHTSSTATYQWGECGTGQFVALPNDTLQAFTPGFVGQYAVIITEGNCADTSSCVVMQAWSVSENANNNALKIFPNPATEHIVIGYSGQLGTGTLRVFNANGKLVVEEKITANQLEVNTKTWPKGVYVVEVETKNSKLSQRVVKL